jgi:hypothetical protein
MFLRASFDLIAMRSQLKTQLLTTMTKPMLHVVCAGLLAAAVAGMPVHGQAQTKEKPATDKKETTEKKPTAGPFHGKLAAVDKAAKTITVGKRTFQITSETKMFKGGKPAVLDEGVVGEEASGYVKPTDDGKLVATKVNFGPKTTSEGTKATDKKKEK